MDTSLGSARRRVTGNATLGQRRFFLAESPRRWTAESDYPRERRLILKINIHRQSFPESEDALRICCHSNHWLF